MTNNANQPIVILKDNVEHVPGNEALRSNIMAAKVLGNTVRTTLGPRGMDKMLVAKGSDDIVITNDGATILHELAVEHPGAKLVVEVAETQDDECGDGTTTAVVFNRLLNGTGRETHRDRCSPLCYCQRLQPRNGKGTGNPRLPCNRSQAGKQTDAHQDGKDGNDRKIH